MVMVVSTMVIMVVVRPANNSLWDIPTNINIYVMCVNPMTVVIVVRWDILLFNSTYLLHHRGLNCVCFRLGCKTEHYSQGDEKRKNKLHNKSSYILDGRIRSFIHPLRRYRKILLRQPLSSQT